MGYSQSKKAIDRVRPVLDLLTARESLHFPTKTPRKLSDAMYNAFHVISRLPVTAEDRIKYGELKDKFKIKQLDGAVKFEFKEAIDIEPAEALSAARQKLEFPEITTLMGIVGAAIKEKVAELIFPDITLTIDEWSKLSKWCDSNNYMMENSHTEHARLILRRKDASNSTAQIGTTLDKQS